MANNAPVCFVPPKGQKAVEKLYGLVKYTELSGGNVLADSTWVHDNLVVLKNVAGTGLNIQLHRLIAPIFEYSLAKAMKAAPNYKIRMLGGYCARHMRHDPKMPLSIHSFGAAFDLNWDKNPMSGILITDFPPALVASFREDGWDWGGSWKSIKDAMHFQFATGC